MITAQELRDLLTYEPETGWFSWIRPPRRGVAAGRTGHVGKVGYVQIGVKGRTYYAHRLAWLYMTGEWPTEQIDHINGCRTDNRFCNLREATPRINAQNKHIPLSSSQTRLIGAWPKRKKFYSQITVDGKRVSLGSFRSAEEAHGAYLHAKRRLHEGNTL